MKFTPILTLLLLTVVSSLAQEVFINPTSVTLTQPGTVTIIVTDTTSATDTVTIGSIQAYNSTISWASNQSSSITFANGSASGTLDAGTYDVWIDGSPQQVTVILWNEPSTSGGVSMSQVGLVSTSATTADQISFQAYVASQAQQQIAFLHIQIDSLQQSEQPEYTDLVPMQEQLASIQTAYDELTNSLSVTVMVTATNGQNGADGKDGKDADNALAYVGMGLGAGAFIGTMVNFFIKDDSKEEPTSSSSTEKNDK